MKRNRKLFCEISPVAYKISIRKGIIVRHIKNLFSPAIAREKSPQKLPYLVYSSNSLIRRQLGNVDHKLQENKAVNLSIAAPKVSGILIKPDQEFSFWALVGACTLRKGYKEGLIIQSGKTGKGVGGGMCQFTNLIHWLVLHSPLTITEHHHHDGIDLFPDFGRVVPFGTGTAIMYNYLDYRFKNTTDAAYQLIVYTTAEYLCGEIRCDQPLPVSYHINTEDEFFSREEDGIYRNSKIYRSCIDKKTGNLICKECIKVNHAKVMYDESFITLDRPRGRIPPGRS